MKEGLGVMQPQAKEHLEPPKARSVRREYGLAVTLILTSDLL